jgi:hypothetical protein
VLLADFYLQEGIHMKDNKDKKPNQALIDNLHRRAFELGNAELLKAASKPYLHTYQMIILQQRLNALPTPRLTEDYLNRINFLGSILFPYFAKFRELARTIPVCARLLIAEGRPREAEAVMDSWRPLTALMMNDDTDRSLIQVRVAVAVGNILSKEAAGVYHQLGETTKEADANATFVRLSQVTTRFKAVDNPGALSHAAMRRHSSYIELLLNSDSFNDRPTLQELTPGRMHEHVLMEEVAADVIALLLTLAMLGAMLQGKVWLFHLRRASAVPILLMAPARVLLRAVLLGTLLPMLIYWVYSRLPVIGGREYGWLYMWPRFSAELLLLAIILLWLPAHLLRKYIRKRCDDLGVDMPDAHAERAVAWKVRGTGLLAFILLAIVISALSQGVAISDDHGIFLFIIVLSLALLIFALLFAHQRRREFGLYYGTLARSLAPVYAWSVIIIMFVAQPFLLYNEAKWLRKDPIRFGQMTNRQATVASYSTPESKACERLYRFSTEALNPSLDLRR